METTIVLNDCLKTNIVVTTFLISVKNDLYTFVFAYFAMVAKFNSLSWFYYFVAMETTVITFRKRFFLLPSLLP